MKYQLTARLFSVIVILSMLLSGLGIPTQNVLAANAGTALQFNGSSQYVTFGASSGTEAPGLGVQVFTIETWFKKTGAGISITTGGGGLTLAIPLITKGRGEADNSNNVDMNYFLGIDSSGVLAADFEECARDQIGCPATASNATKGGQNYPVKGTTIIADNTWYHAAVTFDGRYWKLYLNGVLESMTGADTGANRLPRWDSIQHAGIGTAMNSTGVPGGYFAGIIDEARIWNVVRSQAEIQGSMNYELSSGTGLIGRWGLNEGTGTVSTANSIAGRPNGSLTNSPTWVAGFPQDTTPPAPPTGLAAVAGNTVVNLSWTAPGDLDVAGYNIYRSETSPVSLTSPINGISLIKAANYLDTGRTNGTTYYYVVTAVDTSANQSVASNEAYGTPFVDTTPPVAPGGLAATAGNKLVNITWTANSESDLAGYNLYRSATLGGPYAKVNTPLITATFYSDTNLTKDTPYYYVLTAVDTSTNESGYSAEVTATPFEINTALQFDGANDYVTFGAAPGLGVTSFTLESWIKRSGAGTTVSTGNGGVVGVPIISKGRCENDGSTVDANYFLGINASNQLAADFEDKNTGLNHPVTGVGTIPTDNTWHHVAVTYDQPTGVWNLFLDGNLDNTSTITGADLVRTPRFDSIQYAAIGTALDSAGSPTSTCATTGGYFMGVIDEARIWNYARNQSEIRATINTETSSGTGLIARWGLNEGTGTLANSSVGTFPGTLTNGPVWVSPGAPFNLVFDTTPPAAPTNLMASPRPGAVQLEWTANTETDLAGYRIYRSTSTPVVKGTSLNGTLVGPSFMDSTVTAGTTYYYAVTAVDSSGNESILSNEVNTVPLPPPPAEALALGSNHAYASLGDNADTAQFTLETWLRRDGAGVATTTGSNGETLIPLITNGTADAETADADINYFFGIRGSDGVLCADFEEGQSGIKPGDNHPVCGTTTLVYGAWYHTAATYDGTTWKLYLNGNLEKTLVVGQPANAANISQLAFGTSMKTDNTALGFFDGTLDEVRIWNFARTQAQIASTINSKLTGPETGLLGRWGLDEASGSTVSDSSGNGITGTINGTGYSWVAGATFNATVNLPPAAPALVAPLHGATNVSTTANLSVTVFDPENHPLDVTFYGRPLQAAAGPDFTLVVIPDPQYYSATFPSIFTAQANWVVGQKTTNNIAFVAGLGDNVDVAANATQWTNAAAAWDIIAAGGLPYGITAGNHDGAPSGTAAFNLNFGTSRFAGKTWYGGHYGSDNDNHYELFTASGMNFIVIFIEYDDTMTATDHPVLQWANGLLQANSDRRAIVVTHNLLQGGTSTSFSTQGQTIYNALRANPNLFMILGGHLDVAARRTDIYSGNTVYSLRSDYQSVDSQQSGYMRIMRFSPTDNMIYVRTYSPTQDKDYDKADAAQNNFVLPYAMGGTGFSVIGTATGVASGDTTSVSWSGLDPAAQYEWFVISSDGTHQTSSDTWNFTTASAAPTCYALTLSHAGNGADPTATPANSTGCPTGQYVANEAINLSGATPDAGWQISGWTGTSDDGSNANINTLSMPAGAHSASVNYTQIDYSLTVNSLHGTVTRNPDQAAYHYGDVVTLSVAAEPGWHFTGWSGDITGSTNPIDVTIPGNLTITANFEPPLTLLSPSGILTAWANTFNWTRLVNSTYYHLEVYQAAGSTPIFDQWYPTGICSGLNCSVSPLELAFLVNGNYKWRVQDYSPSGYGAWTEYTNFSLNLPAIGLVAPSGTLNTWNNTFGWTGLASSTYYHLEVYQAAGSTPIFDQWYSTGICSGLNCSISPLELAFLATGDYKWRLQDYSAAGYGDWTAYTYFTLNLPTIGLVAPSGTLTTWFNTFSWTGLDTSIYYHLEVSEASGGAPIIDQWYSTGICTGLNCTVSPSSFATMANGNYKWRVQDYSAAGYGDWTEYTNFTLNLPAIGLVAPSGTLTTWNNTFGWTGSASSNFYHLAVYEAAGSTPIFDQWYSTGICSGSDCTVYPTELATLANGDYKWRLQDYGAGGYGTWTAYTYFTLNLPSIVPAGPSGTLTTWTNTFSWTGLASSSYYHLEFYEAAGSTPIFDQWYTTGICSGLDCTVSPTALITLASGDYKWRVQDYGARGYGTWTAFTNFTLSLPIPLPVAPTGTLTTWDNTFSWTGLASSSYYHLEVYEAAGVTPIFDQWYGTGICTDLNCTVSPAALAALANGEYRWRIQDYSSSGYGHWTAFMTFTLNQ